MTSILHEILVDPDTYIGHLTLLGRTRAWTEPFARTTPDRDPLTRAMWAF